MADRNDPRIVITRPLAGDAVARFAAAGFTNVWLYPEDRTIPRDELLDAVRGADAVLATPADAGIDAELFDTAGERTAKFVQAKEYNESGGVWSRVKRVFMELQHFKCGVRHLVVLVAAHRFEHVLNGQVTVGKIFGHV